MSQPLERYPTPAWMVGELLKRLPILKEDSVFLPCTRNKDPIHEALKTVSDNVTINDLYEGGGDATDFYFWSRFHNTDWVIENPPFSQYFEILENAYYYANKGVAFLLRVTADEMLVSEKKQSQVEFWETHPETCIIKLPRFSFTANKEGKRSTDSAYCQWHIWLFYENELPPIIRVPHHKIPGYTRC